MTAPLPTWKDYTPDPTGEFDVCVWCRVPGCSIKSIEVQHGPTCPSVTGLWPVMPDQAEAPAMTCAVEGCPTVFALGDNYALVPDTETPNLSIVLCVPCSLLHRDKAWEDRT